MKKSSILAAGAVGVSVFGLTTVQADEVTVISSETTETKKATEFVPTKADVEASQANLYQVNANVASQEKVVAAAQTQSDQAKQAVEAAKTQATKAEEIAKQATPENIAKSEADVVEKEKAVNRAETNLTTVKQESEVASQAVAAQNKAVEAAKATVASKQADVNLAEKDVATKQAVLDGTGAAQVVKEAEEAKSDLFSKEVAKASADKELANAKRADALRQAGIDHFTAQKSEKEKALATATNDLKAKSAVADSTAQTLASKQADLSKAQNAVNAINKITLSADYITALKKYPSIYSMTETERDAVLKELTDLSESLYNQNKFVVNPSDDNTTKYDINNLPEHISKELSLFAADLINQVRIQTGSTPVEVTTSSIEFARKVTAADAQEKWDTWTQGHNDKALSAVAKHFSLENAELEQNMWEDWVGTFTSQTVSLADLKRDVYNGLINFLYPTKVVFGSGLEWGHALDIVGLRFFGLDSPEVSYLGVGASRVNGNSGLHFLQVYDTQLTAQSTNFSTIPLTNPYDSKALLAALTVAQTVYNKAESANDSAQADKSTAQAAVTQDQAALAQATEKLAAAEAVEVRTPAAEKEAAAAQTALTTAQERNTKAQAAFSSLNADIKEKQAALAQAKAVLSEKQADLLAAKETLRAEQNTLASRREVAQKAADQVNNRKAELVAANTSLQTVKERVEVLKNAPANLAKAQEALKAAEATLAEKRVALEVQIKKLEELKSLQKDTAEQHAKFVKAYQDYLEAQRQAKIAAEKAAIEKAGKTAVPVIDEKGQIVGYKAQEVAPQTQAMSYKGVYGASPAKVQAQAILPATGSESTSTVLISGMALGMVATLVGFKRKEEN